MKVQNSAKIEFISRSANEGFARSSAACFAAQLDPTLDELGDIKTAVSEAVTNAIVHGYPNELGKVCLKMRMLPDNVFEITVRDWGVGIPDVDKARQPMYTTGDYGELYGHDEGPVRPRPGDHGDHAEKDRTPGQRAMTLRKGDLLAAAQQGDRAAGEELLRENDKLIWSIVQRYANRGVETEDLFQLGCIGFLKAVEGFDPEYGTQFSTYAVPKIAGEIRRFLRDDGTVKVSRTLKEQAVRIRIAREKLAVSLGREPSLTELSAETDLSPEEIAAAETAGQPVSSLQSETAEGLTLESVLGDEGIEGEILESLSLRQAVAQLKERERQVISLRYFRGLTQEQTAKIIGVSQVQISRIERRAVGELRKKLE